MHYLSKSVVCPFYQTSTNYRIQCEGYANGNHFLLNFDGKEQMDSHTKRFCKNINCYISCPLYPIINRQYERGEADE